MSNILLLEDDPVLAKGLSLMLELENYEVSWADNIKKAQQLVVGNDFDLAILDVGLPDGSGLEFCSKMRKEGKQFPIIILTAQTDEQSVITGLTNGANDYVKKPFSNNELIARIRVCLKPPHIFEDKTTIGGLAIYPEKRVVEFKGEEIKFNRKEYDIFKLFIEKKDAVITREMIIEKVLDNLDISDRTVDSHISHIRTRLIKSGVENIKIISEYGIGYRLKIYAEV